jgi:hypothetical protein
MPGRGTAQSPARGDVLDNHRGRRRRLRLCQGGESGDPLDSSDEARGSEQAAGRGGDEPRQVASSRWSIWDVRSAVTGGRKVWPAEQHIHLPDRSTLRRGTLAPPAERRLAGLSLPDPPLATKGAR